MICRIIRKDALFLCGNFETTPPYKLLLFYKLWMIKIWEKPLRTYGYPLLSFTMTPHLPYELTLSSGGHGRIRWPYTKPHRIR